MSFEKILCQNEKKCGGCSMLMIPYSKQLEKKQKRVENLILRFGRVEKIIGMDNPYYYRNKVHAAFSHDRRGNIISGIYERGSHKVVNLEKCYLENEKADEIILTIRKMLKSFKLKAYDEDTGCGFLRHVLVRTAHTTGQILVVIVTGTNVFPSKNNFVKELRRQHPEITTIVQNVNCGKTSMILAQRENILFGKGYIEDELCGKCFRISPKSFYQVNSTQTEILYKKAIEYAALKGDERVLDAYCGIGTIGLVAADYAGEVIGVEQNKDAVSDAIINKKKNKCNNIRFVSADAGEYISGAASKNERFHVVFMDPPRTGSTVKFLDSLVKMRPDKVVYISCNPETLSRDLDYITGRGYRMERAVPVDMFPATEHVECVVLMSRVDK